jgi:hypothetical protein
MLFRTQEPPQWSRRQMIEAGCWVALALLAALYVLYFVIDLDFESRTASRKLGRHQEDFGRAYMTIREQIRRTGAPFQPTPDNALPAEEFIAHAALLLGGANINREQARYARLDIFSSEAYSEPLLYVTSGTDWALASRGPDGAQDMTADELRAWLSNPAVITPLMYDPSNGTISTGDLIMSSRGNDGETIARP